MAKQIVIVGGGIAGVMSAIFAKRKNPNYQITIIEHNDQLLKKINVTGNGKCNFANVGSIDKKYRNYNQIADILLDFPVSNILSLFKELGIIYKINDDLVYPKSESAKTVIIFLLKEIERIGIKVLLNHHFISYDQTSITCDKGTIFYDVLIFACGGVAGRNLGNDDTVLKVLKTHHYDIKETLPSLCPIKIMENVHEINGLRAKVNLKLLKNNCLVYQESGELLFKDDALSGICVFNTSHFIDKESKFYLEIDFAEGENITNEETYESYIHPSLAKYLLKHNLDIHHTRFTFKDFYPLEMAHVSRGGVSLSNLNQDLSSKFEHNVYFVGEVMDVDGLCGGFNIMWAIASAHWISKKI